MGCAAFPFEWASPLVGVERGRNFLSFSSSATTSSLVFFFFFFFFFSFFSWEARGAEEGEAFLRLACCRPLGPQARR